MQSFDHYCAHLSQLEKAYQQNFDQDFIIEGVIYKFLLQFEIALNLLKDLLIHEGFEAGFNGSPRDIIKTASSYFDFVDENIWFCMMDQRGKLINDIYENNKIEFIDLIIHEFVKALCLLRDGVNEHYSRDVLDNL